jgi:formate hydrogenlyase subunit 6/NADH:ubiquinone oxidoreductase subunit I
VVLSEATRGLPELDPTRCDASAACVTACPTRAITVANGQWTLDVGACVFCGACARACPTAAIRLGHRVELAVLDRGDLTITHAVQGKR